MAGDAVVIGGSVIGCAAALQLARAGWQVSMVEPEGALIADRAEVAVRPGAPHVVQPHAYMPRAYYELSRRLPDILLELEDRGVPPLPLANWVPPHLYDGGRPEDVDLTTVRTRRFTFDQVFWAAVGRQDGLEVVEDRVEDLLYEDGDPPRVVGVVLGSGQELAADLVIDAGGRRSPVHKSLAKAGVDVPLETWPCGACYFGQHYEVGEGAPDPLGAGFATVDEHPSVMMLWFLGDNGTAMLAGAVHSEDPLRVVLRNPSALRAVAAEATQVGPWVAASTPTSDVFTMGAIQNALRRPLRDGRPVVLGLHQVGDSLTSTNPTRGRGVSMGLASVSQVLDSIEAHPDDPVAQVVDYGRWVDESLAVYFREAARSDRTMGARLQAGLRGEAAPPQAPSVEIPDGDGLPTGEEFARAAEHDPDLFRVLLRAAMVLDDDRNVASEESASRTWEVLARLPDAPEEPAPTGGLHDRARFEEILSAFV